jgi:hypothetical protein
MNVSFNSAQYSVNSVKNVKPPAIKKSSTFKCHYLDEAKPASLEKKLSNPFLRLFEEKGKLDSGLTADKRLYAHLVAEELADYPVALSQGSETVEKTLLCFFEKILPAIDHLTKSYYPNEIAAYKAGIGIHVEDIDKTVKEVDILIDTFIRTLFVHRLKLPNLQNAGMNNQTGAGTKRILGPAEIEALLNELAKANEAAFNDQFVVVGIEGKEIIPRSTIADMIVMESERGVIYLFPQDSPIAKHIPSCLDIVNKMEDFSMQLKKIQQERKLFDPKKFLGTRFGTVRTVVYTKQSIDPFVNSIFPSFYERLKKSDPNFSDEQAHSLKNILEDLLDGRNKADACSVPAKEDLYTFILHIRKRFAYEVTHLFTMNDEEHEINKLIMPLRTPPNTSSKIQKKIIDSLMKVFDKALWAVRKELIESQIPNDLRWSFMNNPSPKFIPPHALQSKRLMASKKPARKIKNGQDEKAEPRTNVACMDQEFIFAGVNNLGSIRLDQGMTVEHIRQQLQELADGLDRYLAKQQEADNSSQAMREKLAECNAFHAKFMTAALPHLKKILDFLSLQSDKAFSPSLIPEALPPCQEALDLLVHIMIQTNYHKLDANLRNEFFELFRKTDEIRKTNEEKYRGEKDTKTRPSKVQFDEWVTIKDSQNESQVALQTGYWKKIRLLDPTDTTSSEFISSFRNPSTRILSRHLGAQISVRKDSREEYRLRNIQDLFAQNLEEFVVEINQEIQNRIFSPDEVYIDIMEDAVWNQMEEELAAEQYYPREPTLLDEAMTEKVRNNLMALYKSLEWREWIKTYFPEAVYRDDAERAPWR